MIIAEGQNMLEWLRLFHSSDKSERVRFPFDILTPDQQPYIRNNLTIRSYQELVRDDQKFPTAIIITVNEQNELFYWTTEKEMLYESPEMVWVRKQANESGVSVDPLRIEAIRIMWVGQ